MGIIAKLFKHTPVFSFFLVCLLVVGVAFSSIGFGFYQSARQQQKEINAGYTTVAIPYNKDIPGTMPVATGEFVPVTMEQLLEGAPVDYQLDRRVCLGAVVEGRSSWTPVVNMVEYLSDMDRPYTTSVFAVRCEDVQVHESESHQTIYDANGNLEESNTFISASYLFDLSVLETLCFCSCEIKK